MNVTPPTPNSPFLAFSRHSLPVKVPEPFTVIAHRGVQTLEDDSRIAPENTLTAFLEAARFNTAIELDVRATRDGVLVVHHDKKTGRIFTLPAGERRVTDTCFDQIRGARLSVSGHEATVKKILGPHRHYSMNAACVHEKIPTLEAVFDALPKTHIYVELKTLTANPKKNNDLEKRVVRLIQEKNLYDRVTVISFCRGSLRKVKELDPRINTGIDYRLPKPFNLLENFFLNYCQKVLKVDSVHPPYYQVSDALVKKAHARGLALMPWVHHETREEEARLLPKLIAAGIDGVITNTVDLFDTGQK